MRLSTRTRYGTRMMLYLARQDRRRPVPISEISEKIDVSVKYLEQILISLKGGGLVKSIRGAKGGFLLERHPGKITIGEIVRLMESGVVLAPCIVDPSCCERSKNCNVREVWLEATKALFNVFDRLTLKALVAEKEEKVVAGNPPPVALGADMPEDLVHGTL